MRLQCYEGITAAEALYEWNYPRQLLAIRTAESGGAHVREDDLFTPQFLIDRPLLRAIRHQGPRPAVLLIDEIDRADDEFEAFLFELLAESAVTIPELGTVKAERPPIVVLTSNRTRDLHDALKRRCLYHWIDYPPLRTAVAIVRRRVPTARTALVEQVGEAVGRLRTLDVQKPPGIAEAIAWVAALEVLGIDVLTRRCSRADDGLGPQVPRGRGAGRPARTVLGRRRGVIADHRRSRRGRGAVRRTPTRRRESRSPRR